MDGVYTSAVVVRGGGTLSPRPAASGRSAMAGRAVRPVRQNSRWHGVRAGSSLFADSSAAVGRGAERAAARRLQAVTPSYDDRRTRPLFATRVAQDPGRQRPLSPCSPGGAAPRRRRSTVRLPVRRGTPGRGRAGQGGQARPVCARGRGRTVRTAAAVITGVVTANWPGCGTNCTTAAAARAAPNRAPRATTDTASANRAPATATHPVRRMNRQSFRTRSEINTTCARCRPPGTAEVRDQDTTGRERSPGEALDPRPGHDGATPWPEASRGRVGRPPLASVGLRWPPCAGPGRGPRAERSADAPGRAAHAFRDRRRHPRAAAGLFNCPARPVEQARPLGPATLGRTPPSALPLGRTPPSSARVPRGSRYRRTQRAAAADLDRYPIRAIFTASREKSTRESEG